MEIGDYLYIILLAAGAIISMFNKKKEQKKEQAKSTPDIEEQQPAKEITLETILEDLLIPTPKRKPVISEKPVIENQTVQQKIAQIKSQNLKKATDYQFNDDYYTKPKEKLNQINQPGVTLSQQTNNKFNNLILNTINPQDLIKIDAILNRPYQ